MGGDLNLDFMKPKNWMRGMRMKDLKHQYGLFPLFIAIGGGAVFGTAYLINLCLKGPDVSFTLIEPRTRFEMIKLLAPLFGSIVAGVILGSWYMYRLCCHTPDVTWRHAVNPQPFSKCPPTLQYKFLSFIDYSKLKRPKEQPEL